MVGMLIVYNYLASRFFFFLLCNMAFDIELFTLHYSPVNQSHIES